LRAFEVEKLFTIVRRTGNLKIPIALEDRVMINLYTTPLEVSLRFLPRKPNKGHIILISGPDPMPSVIYRLLLGTNLTTRSLWRV
jgi:hypothetical protein